MGVRWWFRDGFPNIGIHMQRKGDEEKIEWGRECDSNRVIGVWKYLQWDNEEGELLRARKRGTRRERDSEIGIVDWQRGIEAERERKAGKLSVRQWKTLMGRETFTYTLLTWISRSCSAPKTADGTGVRERAFQLREKCLLALLVREKAWGTRLTYGQHFLFPYQSVLPFFSLFIPFVLLVLNTLLGPRSSSAWQASIFGSICSRLIPGSIDLASLQLLFQINMVLFWTMVMTGKWWESVVSQSVVCHC